MGSSRHHQNLWDTSLIITDWFQEQIRAIELKYIGYLVEDLLQHQINLLVKYRPTKYNVEPFIVLL